MNTPAGTHSQAESHPQMAEYRASIDNIDAAIVHLLAERFKITAKVGRYKAAHNLAASDPAREARQLERLQAIARQAGLDPTFTAKLLTFITTTVVENHERIRSEEE